MSTSEHLSADEAFRLLCEVGAALDVAPDPDAALATLAGLVVRSAAGTCLVDVLGSDGALRRAASAHRSPVGGEESHQLPRPFPCTTDPGDPIARVVRTGRPLLVPEAEERWLEALAPDPGSLPLPSSAGARSAIVVPIAARGETLGAMTLISPDPGRPYGTDDLVLAEELARRSAIVLERDRLRRVSDEASQAAAQFLGAMTHEFRTPVHIVSMFTELLLLGVPEPIPVPARKHAEHIRAATKHLDELVTQVLAFSRLQSEQETVRPETVDLPTLARETAALIQPLAEQKGLGFVVDLPEGEVVAWTDANKVRQVLFNLLGNAVKFTDSGEVRLAMRVEPGRAVLEVVDTGIGIAAADREKIFEPFWQVDRESGPAAKGTGLGLGIVKRLVDLLRGQVAVESAPGSGSVFRVLLPLGREER